VQESLTDEIYLNVNGNTDSEWAFAVFLSQLKTPLQTEPFCHSVLKEAMLKTITKMNEWGKAAGVTEASMMNFAVTDGVSVVCSRYISSKTLEAASLYFSSGTRFESYKPGHYRMIKADKREDIVVIASEPLTFEKADWLTIPTNTLVVITSKLNVLTYPILDEFHNPSGRAQEQSTVAVVKGEGRDDGARDPNHREVVFVEDRRTLPTLAAIDSPQISNASRATFESSAPPTNAPLKLNLSTPAKGASSQTVTSSSPLMVA
jgi:glutamine amidotransferase